MKVLITGTTGIVGQEILNQIPSHHEVYTFARQPNKVAPNLHCIYGDLTKPDLGIQDWDVFKDIEIVIHLAANTRWNLSDEDAVLTNTQSTQTLLNKTKQHCPNLKHFIYVSTAFVDNISRAKQHDTIINRTDYNNSYEYSKALGEEAVRNSRIPYSIIRPSIIIGRSYDGFISDYSGIYQMFELFFSGQLPAIVGFEDAHLDIVPVDDVAKKILVTSQKPPQNSTYYVSSGTNSPTIKEVLLTLQNTMSLIAMDSTPPLIPSFVKPDTFNRFFLPMIQANPHIPIKHYLKVIHYFKPYLTILKQRDLVKEVNLADDYNMPKLMQTCFLHWMKVNARKFLSRSGRIDARKHKKEQGHENVIPNARPLHPSSHAAQSVC